MKNFLPSLWVRRIIIITLALIIIAVTIYTILDRREKRLQEQQRGIDVVFLDDEQQDMVDTDRDGLYDWEERLWGLDPNKVDTDGDGVSDAQYVRNKQNIQERRNGLENRETNLSQSQQLGRNVFSALLAIEQSGGVLDETTQEQISDNIAQYVRDIPISGKLYVRDELNLVPNTMEETREYQGNIERLLEEYPIEVEDIQLLIESLEDPTVNQDELRRAAEKYDILINELAQMEVPFAIASRHTEFLNSIAHLGGGLKNLSAEEYDELLVFSTIIQMDERILQVQESILNIRTFFEIIADDAVFEDQAVAEVS